MWRPQREELAAGGYPVVTVDLPGHGERMQVGITADTAVAAIQDGVARARAAEVADGPVILVGLSLGGYLSMEAVGRDPRLVDGLIAMGCSTRPFRFGIEVYRRGSRALSRMPDGGRAMDEAVVRWALGRAAAEDILAGGYGIGQSEAAVDVVAGLTPLASVGLAGRSGLPVWFVNGQLDQFRLEERRFVEETPGSLLTVVPGASHMVNLARPHVISNLLLAVAEHAC